MNDNWWSDFTCRLGYEGLFHKRVGDNYPEGAATFYKSSQFKLNQQENSSYTQLAHDVSHRLYKFCYYNLTAEALDRSFWLIGHMFDRDIYC